MATQTYTDKLQDELRHVSDECMPALINIVHVFSQGIVQKTAKESFFLVIIPLISFWFYEYLSEAFI